MRAVRSARHSMQARTLQYTQAAPLHAEGAEAVILLSHPGSSICASSDAHGLEKPPNPQPLKPKPAQLTRTPPKRMAGRRPAATPYPLPGIMILCEGKYAPAHQCTRSQHRSHHDKRKCRRAACNKTRSLQKHVSKCIPHDDAISDRARASGMAARPEQDLPWYNRYRMMSFLRTGVHWKPTFLHTIFPSHNLTLCGSVWLSTLPF